MKYPPVHINDVPISKMEEKNGWNISEFRLPITGESGSSTTVFTQYSNQVLPTANIYTLDAQR